MRLTSTPFASWRAGLLAVAWLLSGASAMAQWVWVDASGRRVFSDMPPPAATPDKDIIKRPGATPPTRPAAPTGNAAAMPSTSAVTAQPGSTSPAPAAPGAPGSSGAGTAPGTGAKPAPDGNGAAPKPPASDPVLEARKREAEAAEAARKRAAAEKIAQARAENCDRAKRAKSTLASGVRVATTNAKGEREVMDDQRRELEIRRLNEIIATDCAPAAPVAP